jgi:hypothetical protein
MMKVQHIKGRVIMQAQEVLKASLDPVCIHPIASISGLANVDTQGTHALGQMPILAA